MISIYFAWKSLAQLQQGSCSKIPSQMSLYLTEKFLQLKKQYRAYFCTDINRVA